MENKGIDRIWELMSRKISNEISFAELEELEVLLKQQTQQAYSLEIMEDLWKSQPAHNSQYAEYKYKELSFRMQKEGLIWEDAEDETNHLIGGDESNQKSFFHRNIRKILIGGSVMVVSLAAVFFLYFNLSAVPSSTLPNKISEVTTKNGSKTNLVLPDGTKVWLNAGSKLSYDNDKYGAELREVSLIGEAFFDVTKNAEKPFVIHTQRMDIKVLGTAFNVRCYPNDRKTETSLIRGKIEVTLKDRPKEKIYLSPNEKLTLLNGNIVTPELPTTGKRVKHMVELTEPSVTIGHITRKLTDSTTIIETSWIENKLEFRGETFEEVASKMERWYGVKINIEDYRLKQEHLTGSFETETVEQALSALQYTTKFNFSTNKNTITITK